MTDAHLAGVGVDVHALALAFSVRRRRPPQPTADVSTEATTNAPSRSRELVGRRRVGVGAAVADGILREHCAHERRTDLAIDAIELEAESAHDGVHGFPSRVDWSSAPIIVTNASVSAVLFTTIACCVPKPPGNSAGT